MFCRTEARGEYDTAPYVFLGPVSYAEHVGERPIAITWELKHPMPTAFFTAASLASS